FREVPGSSLQRASPEQVIERSGARGDPGGEVVASPPVHSAGHRVPLKEKLPLNVGGVASSTMSVPTRSQSGSRSALRIHICRSTTKASGGRGVDNQRKLPPRPCSPTCGTKK